MAVPALADLEPLPLRRGLPWALLGMGGLGLGIALTVRADLGLGPWDVLHQGIAERTGLGIGVANILVGFIVLVLSTALAAGASRRGRGAPNAAQVGVATFLNVVLVGLVVDGTLAVLPEV
ncbi:MAG: hypothetical protein ABIS47_13285, partial [Acidimicrobiales bacterium]